MENVSTLSPRLWEGSNFFCAVPVCLFVTCLFHLPGCFFYLYTSILVFKCWKFLAFPLKEQKIMLENLDKMCPYNSVCLFSSREMTVIPTLTSLNLHCSCSSSFSLISLITFNLFYFVYVCVLFTV